MPGKYTSSEKKAQILAWRQKKVSIKEICPRSEKSKSTTMKLVASAKRELPSNKSLNTNSEKDKKMTSNPKDTLMKREEQTNPKVIALELKNFHLKLLKNVTLCTMQCRQQKCLDLASHKAVKKNTVNPTNKKTAYCI